MKRGKILVLNVGSSSVKYSIFEGLIQINSHEYEKLASDEDYKKSFRDILQKINPDEISMIIHRIVHGGKLKEQSRIDSNVKKIIEKFSEFAPLHNPRQLIAIKFFEKIKKPQYAVFDTSFFSNLPETSRIYAIPGKISEKLGIRRYGFHGLSHKYVSRDMKGKTITCHLGAGSSISAILNGKPIDTSMGLTPLDGVMMTTRSGAIDPGIIFFLEKKGYKAEEILSRESGIKGISGFSDFRNVLSGMKKKRNCRLAYDLFVYNIAKMIGSYIAAMNGVDNLVFTAKIGENVPKLREDICRHFSYIGMKIDAKKNKSNSEIISSRDSKVRVFVKKTNEEQMAVEEVLRVFGK